MDNENRLISDSQKELYANFGKKGAEHQLSRFKGSLERFFGDEKLQIIDVGGGGGYFANAVFDFFSENNTDCSVNVIDYCRYDEWSLFENVVFIEGSIFSEMVKLPDNSVDIIFINHVLHHLVTDSYKKTRELQRAVLSLVHKKLKSDGAVFVGECNYINPVLQNLSIPLVYKMSSSALPFMVNVSKALGSKSAGVGVCFLSRSLWLKEFSSCGFDAVELPGSTKRWAKPLLIIEEFFSFVLTKKSNKTTKHVSSLTSIVKG